jgi:hypothetical protein
MTPVTEPEISEHRVALIDNSDCQVHCRNVRFDQSVLTDALACRGYRAEWIEPGNAVDFRSNIERACIVISRDCGTAQYAQAVGKPLLVFAAAVNPQLRYPYDERTVSVYATCPIGRQFCYHTDWYKTKCPVIDGTVPPCGVISNELLLNGLDELLAKVKGDPA